MYPAEFARRSFSWCRLAVLLFVLPGCATTQVFHRQLPEVRRAIEAVQPEMIIEMDPECKKISMFTATPTGGLYRFELRASHLSGATPYFLVEAESKSPDETKVTVERVRVSNYSLLGFRTIHVRDRERQLMSELARRMESRK
jgi:hypothetical protein